MDQKFLKCRRYSQHGSALKVKSLREASGEVSMKKMHPAARERHQANAKSSPVPPVWIKPQVVNAVKRGLTHRVSKSELAAVHASGRAAGSVLSLVREMNSSAPKHGKYHHSVVHSDSLA